MDVKDFIAPFAVWKRAFEKPFTVLKPIDERPGAPRYRGFHKNDADRCVGCGSCEAICQNAAIDLVPVEGRDAKAGDSGLRPRIDYGRCCWCALCVDICPSGSLTMSNEYLWIGSDPEAFRFTPGVDPKPWDDAELGYRRAEGYRLLDKRRVAMPELPHAEAAGSFRELVRGYSRTMAEREADRCVACGLCVASCPAHMDIPGYIRAVREGDVEGGLRILYETNPFPEACGRVCTHRCEDACAIGADGGDPLAIRWLKRYIADQVELADYGRVLPRREAPTGKKVAVVGAGPGGLSAAYWLASLGHEVTVYERSEKAGGMLRYGIPEYRLPYEALDKDVAYIEALGVRIVYGAEVGPKLPLADLREENDAVFLSTGLPAAYRLDVPGDDGDGVRDGVDVLAKVTRGEDPRLGRKVAVVGGGNVAMDAARTARRLGAEVTVLYRRREVDMPADAEEIREAKAEGVVMTCQAIPVEVRPAPGGGVIVAWGEARMVDQGPGKRPAPELMEDRMHEDRFDTVVAAIGQGPDLSYVPADAAPPIEMRRMRLVVGKDGSTSDPQVFAGGDFVNETKDAISAIADAHRAARAIDRAIGRGKEPNVNFSTFDEAIDFAVAREREAVAFYGRLLGHSGFAAQASMLGELAAMEEGHARSLEAMRGRGAAGYRPPEPGSSWIAGILGDAAAPEGAAGADPDFQTIVREAIRKEARSERLYLELADRISDAALAATFRNLSGEEARHRRIFEELYESEISRDN